ncbi:MULTISPECIES: DUF6377 domain-containing protein [Sphingobacterium]|uniref:DUF6377 domain-containing protein n=1 Tax=Sphingobacterium cellulitidis TaxID=1768011 RepID=A0A8H9FYT1_9SPHI|nr:MULTISPECIES: DUF6377 domain-containing protein [Sphingobacterium]MBA8985561.1 hypothetical protein [Sphingobacterium soli]WFB63979.1 DUF6377 domain-containing protein [Sphingobacterium sp. WM]GGE08660.1 hypothetical protein GCM10011516_02990 [Sphingobacterium soli]
MKIKLELKYTFCSVLCLLILIFQGSTVSANAVISPKDSVERELKKVLGRKIEFEKEKLLKIFDIKERLKLMRTPNDRYEFQEKLYNEFKTYQIDSAIFYVNENKKIAQQLNDIVKKNEVDIQLAGLYSSAGRFIESSEILKGIPRQSLSSEQEADYYRAFSDFYSHYGQSTNHYPYFTLSGIYRDSLLSVLPVDSREHRISSATRALFGNNYDKAEKELLQLLSEYKEPQHERAVIAYFLGLLYKNKDDQEKEIYYLGLSAITDIKNTVKDNASLQSLALVYFERNEIDNAYLFIQEAMEDALFCNVRFRTIENSSFYPIINSAFQEKELANKNQLKNFLYTISFMSILLLVAFIILYMQMKRLKRTRKDLKSLNNELQGLNGQLLKVNQDLQESNHIKEEYMAQFFELCSSYIDKLDNTRKGILKKISNNQLDELSKELKSQDFIKTELDDLYHNFDVIFLNLYPTFIQEFNKLLKPEEQLTLKHDELLNSELRIFALIRLGISDSTKIARFLRYSLRTVYNYRVKVRNKVLGSKEDFDEQIKEIGNLKF